MSKHNHKPSESQLDQIIARLDFIEAQLDDVLMRQDSTEKNLDVILALLQPKVKGVTILQLPKGGPMAITGIQAGTKGGIFEADPVPTGTPFPSGTVHTWTADDPNVTLTPSADTSQVIASTLALDTSVSFNLSVSSQMPAVAGVSPAPLTNSVVVPITPAVAPPPPAPTGVVINQIA